MSRGFFVFVLTGATMVASPVGWIACARSGPPASSSALRTRPNASGASSSPVAAGDAAASPVASRDASSAPGGGDAFGAGGLGLDGLGEGDGGRGEGWGGGGSPRDPRSGGDAATAAVREGATQVDGGMPLEVVQRIARQRFGRAQRCYESGLRSNPALRGRVTLRFVIDRAGGVSEVRDGGSDLSDRAVVACVVRAFSGLAFPQPAGGPVRVVYPIHFSPGEAAPG